MIFLFALQCAVLAFVYAEILVMGGEILNPWYKFLERHLSKKPWIFKPVVECSKCVAGQISLWAFPFFYSYHYSIFEHLSCISLSILFLLIIKKMYTKFIDL